MIGRAAAGDERQAQVFGDGLGHLGLVDDETIDHLIADRDRSIAEEASLPFGRFRKPASQGGETLELTELFIPQRIEPKSSRPI